MEIYYPNSVPIFVCVGRNYVEHIREMKGQKGKSPMIFFKPSTALTYEDELYFPKSMGMLHYEVEMTILMGKKVYNVDEEHALSAIWGYGVGVDLTLRDMQSGFKEKGLSWGLSKGFDNSAPLGGFVKKDACPDLSKVKLHLNKNGKTVQDTTLDKMIFSPAKIISHVSKFMTLRKGYVIMTGTPAGVGPVKDGDKFHGTLGNISNLKFSVERR